MKTIRRTLAGLSALWLLLMLTACLGQEPKSGARGLANWYASYGHDGPKSRMLGAADIAVGSLWTDGQFCYMVTSTDDGLIRMEGGTLHEGGGVCVLAVEDAKTLRVAMPEEGYTTFAEDSLLVTHQLLTVEVDSLTTRTIEVLIAYKEGDVPFQDPCDLDFNLAMVQEDTLVQARLCEADMQERDGTLMRYPVAVLQRLGTAKSPNRDEAYDEMLEQQLAFELADIHAVLAGTYSSQPQDESLRSSRQWTFLPDGRVHTALDTEPQSYGVELAYHSPTDVIRMPDGTRYSVLHRKTAIFFREAVYDKVEEFWRNRYDDDTFDFELSYEDCWPRPLWTHTRILTPAMLTVMDADLHRLSYLYDDMGLDTDPIRLLNYYLLLQMSKQMDEDDGTLSNVEVVKNLDPQPRQGGTARIGIHAEVESRQATRKGRAHEAHIARYVQAGN